MSFGALQFRIAVLGIMIAITDFGSAGATLPWSLTVLVPLAISSTVGVFFVRGMTYAREPIIPLSLFRGRGFSRDEPRKRCVRCLRPWCGLVDTPLCPSPLSH